MPAPAAEASAGHAETEADSPGPALEIALEDDRWAEALGGAAAVEALAAEACAMGLRAAGLAPEGWSVSLLFADDATVAELNGRFRGKSTPTNVLSWPAFDLAAEEDGAAPELPQTGGGVWAGEAESLGDVAFAFETVAQEAAEQGLTLRGHALHLGLHGVLHLLGFDHERDGDARRMEDIERRMLVASGHPDPYLADDIEEVAPDAATAKARSDGL